MRLLPILGKWQVGIRVVRADYMRGRLFIQAWWLKFVSFPYEGECISKKNYRGLYFYRPLAPFQVLWYARRFRNFTFRFPLRVWWR